MLPHTAHETIYYVRDLDRAVEFYTQTLGLKLIEKFDWGFALVEADDEGSTIGLMDENIFRKEFPQEEGRPSPRLVFQVSDLDAQLAELHAKDVRISPISGKKGETRAAHFWDPDGNPFFVWEPGSTKG